MQTLKQTISVSQKTLSSDTLQSHNLLNDFATLGALLLTELEAGAAPVSAHGETEGSASEAPQTSQLLQSRNDHLLDAFLLAAGMNQIMEDYLHQGVNFLDRLSNLLESIRLPLIGNLPARGIDQISTALYYLRAWSPRYQRLIRWQAAFARFTEHLADQMVHQMSLHSVEVGKRSQGTAQMGQPAEDLVQVGRALLASGQLVPEELARKIIRIPSCFRSFDQRPEDCQYLTRLFAERWPDRALPLLVVGIRTSGSYLAPLYAAMLRGMGYREVQSITLRPGQRWLRAEHACLIQHAKRGGRILLADDPPATGSSFVASARALEAVGINRKSISLLAPLFSSLDSLPPEFGAYDTICLPWEDWAIHHQMMPDVVEKALAKHLTGQTIRVTSSQGQAVQVSVVSVKHVERLPLLPAVHALNQPLTVPVGNRTALRGHIRGLYRVQLVDKESGKSYPHSIYVKGIGLGYFGRYSLAVARPLRQFFPAIYGVQDGLLYRAWLAEEQRLSTLPDDVDSLAAQMASYVAQRRQFLPVPEDFSQRLGAGKAVWWRGTYMLRNAFGRVAPLARPAVLRTAKHLLQGVEHPLAIDGSMSPGQWFAAPEQASAESAGASSLLKVDFDDRGFSNLDLNCSDAFFDLAMTAVYADLLAGGATAFPQLLRQHFARLTGETTSDERWLLYQMILLWKERELLDRALIYATGRRPYASTGGVELDERAIPSTQNLDKVTASTAAMGEVERELSRLYARYLGDCFLRDVTPAASGPLCAIDIDGVLEMGWLSFPAITPDGALALRALSRHGYRPVIATGRSLGEVRDRCQAYRLAGAVAEYGAVIYNHLTGQSVPLLTETEQADLDALRSIFQGMEGVFLDSTYRYAVRAYRLDRHGHRRGLSPETIEQALAQLPAKERLRTIVGMGQTDFMVTTVDKGTGLRALAESLGGATGDSSAPSLAFAAGDTISDLPMFERATHAFAPANADALLRERSQTNLTNLRIMKRPYQSGLLQAASLLLGHDPHRCATCKPPQQSSDAALLLTALAAQDGGKWRKVRQALLLAMRATRTR